MVANIFRSKLRSLKVSCQVLNTFVFGEDGCGGRLLLLGTPYFQS